MTTLIQPNSEEPFAVFLAEGRQSPLAIAEDAFIAAYKKFGAVLLRGYATDLESFGQLTHRYCSGSVFNESPGRNIIDRGRNVQTVDLGTAAFPLHPEVSREPWKPDICFFWCARAPKRGGETTLCDGVELVKQLVPSTRATLEGRKLAYTLAATPSECAYWLGTSEPDDNTLANPPAGCPYKFERAGGLVWRTFIAPMLHKPMFADDLAFGNFLLFGRFHQRIRDFPTYEDDALVPDSLLEEIGGVADRVAAPIRWRDGDIAVLDNTRFMHGRNAIIDVAERRIATYFGYVRFAQLTDAEKNAPWRRGAFQPP